MSAELAKKVVIQAKARVEVKGPIRCHKCQLCCRDAAQYLEHKCEMKQRYKN